MRHMVVTTVQDLTEDMYSLFDLAGWHVWVIGDKKTPQIRVPEGTPARVSFVSVSDQAELGLSINTVLPYNHYARKNVGYLLAMGCGAEVIAETDDDNAPLPDWWDTIGPRLTGYIKAPIDTPLFNVYAEYSSGRAWPRGFPLDNVSHHEVVRWGRVAASEVMVWQGLVEGEPDVDAVFRLIYGSHLKLDGNASSVLALGNGTYCPFNSQNTVWRKQAYTCMYLPSSVNSRFSDILRSYVAERVLNEQGWFVGYTPPSMVQRRNPHDLMRDLEQEVGMYIKVPQVIDSLRGLSLSGDIAEDMRMVYTRLVEDHVVDPSELRTLAAWLRDVREVAAKAL